MFEQHSLTSSVARRPADSRAPSGSLLLLKNGTDAQRRRYRLPSCQADRICSFAISEVPGPIGGRSAPLQPSEDPELVFRTSSLPKATCSAALVKVSRLPGIGSSRRG